MENLDVIFIDDEEITYSTIRRLEYIHGLKVKWAKSPEEGWSLVKNYSYKVIVLDIMMPIRDKSIFKDQKINNTYGLETGIILIKKINELETCKDSVKIFCSARREKVIDDYDLKKGQDFHYYFQKPFDTSKLYYIIKKSIL